MTKAELIKLLEPYPDDIRLVIDNSEYTGREDLLTVEEEEIHLDVFPASSYRLSHSYPKEKLETTTKPVKVLHLS